tara:strand:- start:303 stop:983 length:681 start_codon:yes stop_codon:yes gene_type:complete
MLKLNYFNGRGLGETCRLILKASNVEFEDFRYPIKILDWATYNMVREEFEEDKASGKLWRSMGKLPFLEVDGRVISQSKAMQRYLAKKCNMMGDSDEQAALIDSYCEYIRDFKSAYQSVRKATNKEEAMEKWFGDTLPEKLEMLNNLILGNVDFQENLDIDRHHSVGNTLSLADIVIYSFLVDFFDNKEGVEKAYNDCHMLKRIVNHVGNIDGIKQWVANRPETAF